MEEEEKRIKEEVKRLLEQAEAPMISSGFL
jgi:hypothetical protein